MQQVFAAWDQLMVELGDARFLLFPEPCKEREGINFIIIIIIINHYYYDICAMTAEIPY